jgi:hypothetical protein
VILFIYDVEHRVAMDQQVLLQQLKTNDPHINHAPFMRKKNRTMM